MFKLPLMMFKLPLIMFKLPLLLFKLPFVLFESPLPMLKVTPLLRVSGLKLGYQALGTRLGFRVVGLF